MRLHYGDTAAREVSARIATRVASTADLAAIPERHRANGMLALAGDQLYFFDASATNAGTGVIAPDAGDGKWLPVTGAGQDAKGSVRAASTTNLSATRTANVLEADANGALAAMDGVTLVAGDRVLLKDQVTGADNGIYVVTSLGAAGAKYSFTRAADADASAKVTAGMLVPVTEGTANGDRLFQLTTNDPIALNTTALVFSGGMSPGDKTLFDAAHGAAGTALTDADATIAIAAGAWRVLPAATLTANRALTLGTTGAVAGTQITVTRLDAEAFTLAIINGGAGAGTLVTLPASMVASAVCQFDGTNWALRQVGAL